MNASEKLLRLRALLVKERLDGFILQRGDEFLNEYVAPYAERLAWLTGFTGSAGMAVILSDRAAVFSDGRYTLQLQQQVDPDLWECHHITKTPPLQWILSQQPSTLKLGYDPKLFSKQDLKAFHHETVTLFPIHDNPIDQLWQEQPGLPARPIVPHDLIFAGVPHEKKIDDLQRQLKEHQENAYIFCDPASICWLLNIRGSDIPYTPIPLVFAILHQDHVTLYAEPEQYNESLRQHLGKTVTLQPRQALAHDLKKLHGHTIGIDPDQTPIWFIQILEQETVTLHYRTNPILILKACKNPTEQQGARQAHLQDGIAMCRFLCWLEDHGIGLDEIEVARHLNQFRQEAGKDSYQEESFPAISATGANAAIIHYQATVQNHATLQENQPYLIDSGGQYQGGTTDITRTVWLGKTHAPDRVRETATRVLKGHIALSATLFPKGTTGSQLDVLARYALWQKGLNYDHGTGHGVGSFLSVHEGPCRISPRPFPVPLMEGMILSNEPGYYLQGQYGIRLENLLLVQPADVAGFLRFEPLTLVPFDHKIILNSLLTSDEKTWLNHYHALIVQKISPFLNKKEQKWLIKMCVPIS